MHYTLSKYTFKLGNFPLHSTAETAPPNFIQRLQSMTARQGSKVRLDVRVTGIPTPVVKFYREGAEIQSSPDFQIVQDGDLYSLIIAELFMEDSGTFSVTATNSVGRATSTAELHTQGICCLFFYISKQYCASFYSN